ncbi:hypothetical protein HMPREF3226_02671 [Prevotella corporis]|uniref:Uncharacterized protein n=1 Tax=Prevotella corporis TaxID=28128 RepID=A0A133PTL6_9BACT|nr:hypothetical protein HMPREF3226_02671 [Prevotella corporis]
MVTKRTVKGHLLQTNMYLIDQQIITNHHSNTDWLAFHSSKNPSHS